MKPEQVKKLALAMAEVVPSVTLNLFESAAEEIARLEPAVEAAREQLIRAIIPPESGRFS